MDDAPHPFKKQINQLVSNLTGLVETQVQLLKLDVEEQIAHAMSAIFLILLLLFFSGLAIIGGSVAAAIALGQYFSNILYGTLLVTAFYTTLLLCIIIWRKRVWQMLSDRLELIIDVANSEKKGKPQSLGQHQDDAVADKPIAEVVSSTHQDPKK